MLYSALFSILLCPLFRLCPLSRCAVYLALSIISLCLLITLCPWSHFFIPLCHFPAFPFIPNHPLCCCPFFCFILHPELSFLPLYLLSCIALCIDLSFILFCPVSRFTFILFCPLYRFILFPALSFIPLYPLSCFVLYPAFFILLFPLSRLSCIRLCSLTALSFILLCPSSRFILYPALSFLPLYLLSCFVLFPLIRYPALSLKIPLYNFSCCEFNPDLCLRS